MNCPDCKVKMRKFKARMAKYQYKRVNDVWVCISCGYDKEITRREK